MMLTIEEKKHLKKIEADARKAHKEEKERIEIERLELKLEKERSDVIRKRDVLMIWQRAAGTFFKRIEGLCAFSDQFASETDKNRINKQIRDYIEKQRKALSDAGDDLKKTMYRGKV